MKINANIEHFASLRSHSAFSHSDIICFSFTVSFFTGCAWRPKLPHCRRTHRETAHGGAIRKALLVGFQTRPFVWDQSLGLRMHVGEADLSVRVKERLWEFWVYWGPWWTAGIWNQDTPTSEVQKVYMSCVLGTAEDTGTSRLCSRCCWPI